jgi:hypothetical protein
VYTVRAEKLAQQLKISVPDAGSPLDGGGIRGRPSPHAWTP